MTYNIRILITTLCMSLSIFAHSKEPKIDGDISQVISSDSWKDTEFRTDVAPYFRFRAIRYDPIKAESGGRLVLEKLYKSGVGSTYKIHFSKNINLLSTKNMKAEFEKLQFESKASCCHPTQIKWDGFKLSYYVSINNKYKCVIPNVNKGQVPSCRLVK